MFGRETKLNGKHREVKMMMGSQYGKYVEDRHTQIQRAAKLIDAERDRGTLSEEWYRALTKVLLYSALDPS